MDELGRAWRRRALAAGGAVVIAPVAMVGAALAVGFGGGAGSVRLGALGQAFSGPAAPAIERRADDDGRRPRTKASRSRAARDPEQLLAALTPEPSRPSVARPRATAPRPPGTRTVPGSRPRAGGTVPAPAPAPSTPAPAVATPAPTPAPPASPGPVGQVGDDVAGLLEGVPVVGPPAGGLVDSVTDQVDGVVP